MLRISSFGHWPSFLGSSNIRTNSKYFSNKIIDYFAVEESIYRKTLGKISLQPVYKILDPR